MIPVFEWAGCGWRLVGWEPSIQYSLSHPDSWDWEGFGRGLFRYVTAAGAVI